MSAAQDEPTQASKTPETREAVIRAVPIRLDRARDPDPRTPIERLVAASLPSRDAILALYL